MSALMANRPMKPAKLIALLLVIDLSILIAWHLARQT